MKYTFSSNASRAAAALTALGVEGPRAAGQVTQDQAKRLKKLIQDNAPVGPPKRTTLDGEAVSEGHYRRSIKYRTRKVASGRTAEVYSTAPYARRLEFGFTGMTDAAGRYFRYWETTPKPHWQPQVDKVEKELEARYAAALREAARKVAAGFRT